MEGFGLLVGHLIGDYIFQEDWVSGNKTNPPPGPEPAPKPLWEVQADPADHEAFRVAQEERNIKLAAFESNWFPWQERCSAWRRGHLACTIHCILYTFAIFITSPWMPWWAYLATGLIHWPIDRFRLARKWMSLINQERFATGPFSPWSIIVVDNTFHLITLYVIALLSKSAMGLP